MQSFFRAAVIGIAVTAVPACANIDLDQAKKLSGAGVTSSTTLQAEAKTTAARVSGWRDARVFELVLTTGQVKALEDEEFILEGTNLDTLAKLLRKRTSALAGLVEAYKSFQALANYGAGAETEQAAAAFFASTNDFLLATQALPLAAGGETANRAAPISPQASEGLSIAFGIIATEVQKGQVKKASVALRTGIETLAVALNAERQYAVAARTLLARYRNSFRAGARQAGLVDYEPAIRELLAQYDLDPAKDITAAIRRYPSARLAIEQLVKTRDAATLAGVDEKYGSLLQLLDDLVKQHKALEAGHPVNVADILVVAQQIEGYYERVRDAGKKSDAAK